MPVVWPLIEQLPTVRHVVVMDDGGTEPLPDDPRVRDYEALLDEVPAPTPPVTVDENDAASLCYTSGTTGRPKGVLYSHRSIVLHALLLLGADSFAISERDVVLPIVPMFHVNAWGLPYASMLAGADLVLPGPAMSPAALAGQMSRHRVTFAAARNGVAHKQPCTTRTMTGGVGSTIGPLWSRHRCGTWSRPRYAGADRARRRLGNLRWIGTSHPSPGHCLGSGCPACRRNLAYRAFSDAFLHMS